MSSTSTAQGQRRANGPGCKARQAGGDGSRRIGPAEEEAARPNPKAKMRLGIEVKTVGGFENLKKCILSFRPWCLLSSAKLLSSSLSKLTKF
jgi:hypothetical protein